jgi:hypothetical protein
MILKERKAVIYDGDWVVDECCMTINHCTFFKRLAG